MLYAKPCKCGSTEFEKELDDNVLRCAHCFSLARFGWYDPQIKKTENKEKTNFRNYD